MFCIDTTFYRNILLIATMISMTAIVLPPLSGCAKEESAPDALDGPASQAENRQQTEHEAIIKRVVIITGEDYVGHHWELTGPALQAELQHDARLDVDLVEDVNFTRSQYLHDFDVVVIHFKNYDPEIPGREGFDNLKRFVEQGGGLVSVHFGCGAFEEFKSDFEGLIGRTWIGINDRTEGVSHHDAYGPFTVEIVDTDHPICQGMTDFETTDELYTCLEGDTAIQVLGQATSNRLNKPHPQFYIHQPGEGRVFVSTLGHDVAALMMPGTAEMYRRGTAWAAGLTPTANESPQTQD